jgi:hypothetical protein
MWPRAEPAGALPADAGGLRRRTGRWRSAARVACGATLIVLALDSHD